jgi:hypothetical protein
MGARLFAPFVATRPAPDVAGPRAAAAPAAEPTRQRSEPIETGLTIDAQWRRLGASVARVELQAAKVAAEHEAVARQLDAAEYALHCLIADVRNAAGTPILSTLERAEAPVYPAPSA